MATTIKVDNVQNTPGTNIINKCSVTTTIGAGAGDTINVCGATVNIGRCGGTVNLTSGATQSGFGRTGTVDWVTTPKVTGDSPVTGATGSGYFLNTTAGAITLNLPAGAAGSIVSLADYAATWQTNNVTVTPNGTDKIGAVNASVGLSTEGQSVTLVYVDSTQGWVNTMDSTSNIRASAFMVATGGTPSQCGDYEIRKFTGPGTFNVTATAACAADNAVDYLVVAGGAAGGYGDGGGGGAGGYRNSFSNPGAAGITVTASPYAITVGAGGPTPGGPAIGPSGSDSIFSTITSAGGGGGGIGAGCAGDGGSGGGASYNMPSGAGSGDTPAAPVLLGGPQGNDGGNGTGLAPRYGNAGGGGAAAAGACGTTSTGGDGGAGSANAIDGTPTYYAGGGGGSQGGSSGPPATLGDGGTGGGGDAGNTGRASTSGTVNTGGGGGGSGFSTAAGSGGSGIIILRYKFQ